MSEHNYRADIDGLRAIAVLAVVVFHAFPTTLPGGFVGVDVFFVISGYMITGIIQREVHAGRFSFIDFYARRARRIFPALIVVLVTVLIAGWFLMLADEYRELGKHVAAGAAFGSNIVLLFEAGYFDVSAVFKPLLHLWSLGIEEQFYLVWPAVIVGAFALRWRMSFALVAIGLASLAYSLLLTRTNVHEAFYLPQSRFWELAAGGVLAVVGHRVNLAGAKRDALALTAVLLLAFSVIWVREDVMFPAPAALLWSAPGTLVGRWILGNPVMRAVGLISYPLYLWHWPLLSLPSIVMGGATDRPIRIAGVLLAFVLAWLTYQLLEKPIRSGGKLRLKAAVLTGLLFIVGLGGFGIFIADGLPNRPAVSQTNLAQVQFASGAMWEYTSNDACLDRYPLAGSEDYGWWFCEISKDAEPTVLLLGSSYANHHFPGVAHHPAMADEIVLSIGACEPSWIDPEDVVDVGDNFSPCIPSRRLDAQLLTNDIIEKTPLKLVIMDGLLSEPDPAYIVDLKRRVDFIEQSGAKVLILTPHVKADYFTRACFGRPYRAPAETCEVPRAKADEVYAAFAPLVESLQSTNPYVKFFDPNTVLCDDEVCGFVKDGLPVFRDQFNHLGEYGAGLVAKEMLSPDVLTWAGLE